MDEKTQALMNIDSHLARIADALEILTSAIRPEFKDRDAALRIYYTNNSSD